MEIKLSNEQEKIIKENNSNLLVISGAGCGKTFTIVKKVKYLLKHGYKNEEILCISFTNDSVNSLKEKLNNTNIDVLTFHKLAINILSEYNIVFKIADDDFLLYLINELFLNNFFDNKNIMKIIKYLTKAEKEIILKKEIFSYIKKLKCNNETIHDIYKIKNKKIRYFNIICLYIFKYYEIELQSQKLMDFDDLIILAEKCITKRFKNYKYLIIDEFQDTSFIRLSLIKKIALYNNIKMMFVGDDFQSIYRFTGCNLEIFINLNKYIKNINLLYLSTTYRFSKELALVSTNFILKNNNQLKKEIISFKKNYKPIKIVYYKKSSDIYKLIKLINNKILILGRNNNDILKYYKVSKNGYINDNLRYLTVHKAKGLEEDEVIIINLENKIDGFPSKIKSNYLKDSKEEILYAEERRLFYVALTRTKNNVYLFCNKNNLSIFVKEIKKDYKKYIEVIKL